MLPEAVARAGASVAVVGGVSAVQAARTYGEYCEACGRPAPEVVVYLVRVRGAIDFHMCARCRVRHGAELIG